MKMLRKGLRQCYSIEQCRLKFKGGRTNRIHTHPSPLASCGEGCLGKHGLTKGCALERDTSIAPVAFFVWGVWVRECDSDILYR